MMCDATCSACKREADVRATKPHTVQLTLLVDAEHAGKAVEKIVSAYAGTGITVHRVTALPFEPEDDRW